MTPSFPYTLTDVEAAYKATGLQPTTADFYRTAGEMGADYAECDSVVCGCPLFTLLAHKLGSVERAKAVVDGQASLTPKAAPTATDHDWSHEVAHYLLVSPSDCWDVVNGVDENSNHPERPGAKLGALCRERINLGTLVGPTETNEDESELHYGT